MRRTLAVSFWTESRISVKEATANSEKGFQGAFVSRSPLLEAEEKRQSKATAQYPIDQQRQLPHAHGGHRGIHLFCSRADHARGASSFEVDMHKEGFRDPVLLFMRNISLMVTAGCAIMSLVIFQDNHPELARYAVGAWIFVALIAIVVTKNLTDPVYAPIVISRWEKPDSDRFGSRRHRHAINPHISGNKLGCRHTGNCAVFTP